MRQVLAIAPHPDDETIGCGGSLLRHRRQGDRVHWLIVTAMAQESGFTAEAMRRREAEIGKVSRAYGFASTTRLGYATTRLDSVPRASLVAALSAALRKVRPDVVYVPFAGDVHSDHRVAAEAASAAVKWFRCPSVRRVLAYETLSETDFDLGPASSGFRPTVFADIGPYLRRKLGILSLYAGESAAFPFPRSSGAVTALARVRGAASGFQAAEAFSLLRERV